MIFLDANCFLRWLVSPVTIEDEHRVELVGRLFNQLRDGLVEATTSETVFGEVAFNLTSKRQYNLPVAVAVEYLTVVLNLPGLVIPGVQRRQWQTALSIWDRNPAIGFADALTYAIVSDQDHELATLDHDFARFRNIRHYWPEE